MGRRDVWVGRWEMEPVRQRTYTDGKRPSPKKALRGAGGAHAGSVWTRAVEAQPGQGKMGKRRHERDDRAPERITDGFVLPLQRLG